MSATQKHRGLELRQLPASARKATAEKAAAKSAWAARAQFSRVFADVLSGRFGGNWSVEWGGRRDAASTEHTINHR